MQKITLVFLLTLMPALSFANRWMVDQSSSASFAQVSLPSKNGKTRNVLVVFEFQRSCDPIFSIIELYGTKFGKTIGQKRIDQSPIGIVLDGGFHTSYALITNYSNGYEAGFAVQNNLYNLMLGEVRNLEYVTPYGEHLKVPTSFFNSALIKAFDICKIKVMGK